MDGRALATLLAESRRDGDAGDAGDVAACWSRAGLAGCRGAAGAVRRRGAVRRAGGGGCWSGRGAVWNLYGPTETTIWSSAERGAERGRGGRSIGRPIANTQIYVLDGRGQPVPVGVAGELYIGGVRRGARLPGTGRS